jgi:hypothetical protein
MIHHSQESELKSKIQELKFVMPSPPYVEKDEGMGRSFTKKDLFLFVEKLTDIIMMLNRSIDDIWKEIENIKSK